jgi:hypothetical protein
MANDRLYRENVYFGLAYREAFADPEHPTIAELNGPLVFDVTCALWEDDTEFTLGSSELDSGLTFCSKAGEQSPTFMNPTVVFGSLMDKERNATGLFNRVRDLIMFPDIPFYAITRIGERSDVDFAAGQKIDIVSVKTDNVVPTGSSGENGRWVQNFLNDGFVNWGYVL